MIDPETSEKCNAFCEGDIHAVLDNATSLSDARTLIGSLTTLIHDELGVLSQHSLSVGETVRIVDVQPAEVPFVPILSRPDCTEPVIVTVKKLSDSYRYAKLLSETF